MEKENDYRLVGIDSRKYLKSRIISIIDDRTVQNMIPQYKLTQIISKEMNSLSTLALILIYESLIKQDR